MTVPTPYTTSDITIFDASASSSNAYINVLLLGNKWGGSIGSGATVYYSFPFSRSDEYWSQDFINGYGVFDPISDPTPDYVSLTPFSSSQQNGITLALNAWANVANLDFIKVDETPTTVGDIRFGFTSDGLMSPEYYAYTYTVNAALYDYSSIFPYTRSGDIWFNDDQSASPDNTFEVGTISYFAGLHEIGHALGLDHSFAEEDGEIGLPAKIDYIQYTVMSYSDRPGLRYDGLNEYYPTTPMLYDILAIQHLYGANNSYNADDTVYEFSSSQHYYETIWDGGGNDTIKYTSSTGGVINLEAGAFSRLGQTFKVGPNNATVQQDNIAIAFNVVIENAIGGSGNDKITGNSADNHLQGGTGNDTLDGAAGNDIIDGEDGVDKLIGGAGDDTYIVDLIKTGKNAASYKVALQDTITEAANAGTDTVQLRSLGSIDYSDMENATTLTLGANLENLDVSATEDIKLNLTGNSLDNILTGNDADNILDGGKGIDTLIGGAGNDTYILDLKVSAGNIDFDDTITEDNGSTEGVDTVKLRGTTNLATAIDISLNLWTNIETLDASATGTTKLTLKGNDEDNTLIGNNAANILEGGLGNDILNGGAGADTMIGGKGWDTYYVDNIKDVIVELENTDHVLADEGIDTILSSISLSLANYDNVEYLTLLGKANLNATGNDGSNLLIGNAGNNILDGGGNRDDMQGGAGNDTYIVDDVNDQAIETIAGAAGGIDIVLSSVSFSLNYNVENLTLTGTENIDGYGNELNNTIRGNAGNNRLGGGGDGSDTLIGGAGNDIYEVTYLFASSAKPVTQDTVIESLNAGIDSIILSAAGNNSLMNKYLMPLNVENLDATNTYGAFSHLIGNNLANYIIGNDYSHIFDGGAGIDTLVGGNISDTYIVDLVTNIHAGVTTAALQDIIIEDASGDGSDTIQLRGNVKLTTATTLTLSAGLANVENLDASLTSSSKLNLTGNDANNVLTGNDAANTLTGGFGNDLLNGGAGIDTMIGGDGDDTYIVDNIADIVTEDSNEGTDLVKASVSYTLGDNVENLELTGTAAINGTGNDDANIITGNAGNNILDGKGGIDTLIGGKGNDTYIVDDKDDEVIEAANEGIDLVKASVDYELTDFVENLTLTGNDHINGTGNALANIITGNAGNNILDGGAGVDKLIGGNGDDTYIVDLVRTGTTPANFKVALQDTITETALAGSGTDTVILRGTFTEPTTFTTLTLGANLENLNASDTGLTKLNLTGNVLANTLTGNDTNNILDGGAGVDTLIGGLGDDTYVIDIKTSAGSILIEDTVTELNGTTEGIDTVKLRGTATLATAATLTLDNDWANIEILDASATGSTKLDLTGNNLGNTLIGNAAANILTGGTGDDILNGGAGADTMIGGDGDDTYIVDNIADIVTEDSNEGTDLVKASVSYTLGDNVENLELTGTAAINGTGNDDANIITGNAGNNILDGKGGIDTLIGGKGNDTYIVDDKDDEVIEAANEGIDLVKASVDYELTDFVENLTLTGNDHINGTGNALANIITGNAGNNILDGGAGVDKLIGGNGDDTYIVDLVRTGTTPANFKVALQDTITETALAGSGTDTVILRGTFTEPTTFTTLTLGANLENLNASDTGLTKLNLTGNALANTLTGNDANNILDGGAGNDILIGGKGSDTLKGGLGADVFKWSLDDAGTAGDISQSTDTITDFSFTQTDQLDLRDLLIGESTGNILDYIDIVMQGSSTHIRISSTGNFTGGAYNTTEEDVRIVLSNTNLFNATNSATEAELVGYLINNPNQTLLIG